jgi:hypothetical protein
MATAMPNKLQPTRVVFYIGDNISNDNVLVSTPRQQIDYTSIFLDMPESTHKKCENIAYSSFVLSYSYMLLDYLLYILDNIW